MSPDSVVELRNFLQQFPTLDSVEDPLIIIPCFENPDYVVQFLRQLEKRGLHRFILLDGGSESPEMLQVLAEPRLTEHIIVLPDNPGPKWFFENTSFFEALPEVFVVSDPDLILNNLLPENFLAQLHQLTHEFHVGKAGLALDIENGVTDQKFFVGNAFVTVRDWEQQFWSKPLNSSSGELVFEADIDTTFALYNKDFFSRDAPSRAVRVAGKFSAKHIPWFPELSARFNGATAAGPHSNWLKENEEKKIERIVQEKDEKILRKTEEIERLKSSASWRLTEPFRTLGHWFVRLRKNS